MAWCKEAASGKVVTRVSSGMVWAARLSLEGVSCRGEGVGWEGAGVAGLVESKKWWL